MLRVEPATELLERARAGETAALAELYHGYADRVYGAAFKLTQSATEAEDVLQDVFLGLPEALATYEARGRFGSWLSRIAARRALITLRVRRRRREVSLSSLSGFLPGNPLPSDPVTRLAFERAIEALPDKYRIAFVLHEIEGFSHQEVAELSGICVSAAHQRHYRAVRLLRTLLT